MSRKMPEFPERRGNILRIIVAEYIASATPVGSENIVRSYSLGISPATTRHEMARLEEEGYIIRPHTSAGGMPSDKGYRYYVESLLRESRLSQEDRMAIRGFFDEVEQEPEEWARQAVSVLTRTLESMALATLPHAAKCCLRHIHLVALQDMLVLMVLVLQAGQVKKRILSLTDAVSQDKLDAWANRMNDVYGGLTCQQIAAQGLELSPVEEQITEVVAQLMKNEDEQQYEEFYLDGLRHLVSRADMMEGRQILGLVEAIEDRKTLSKLLGSLGDVSGIRVTIGDENEEEALHGCSVILSNYGVEERKGAIGVIGPTRMQYSRAIPVVDYVSALMSELLGRMYA